MPSYTSYINKLHAIDANDDNIESWITVRGNHIPIMKGQSKEEAVKAFIEGKKKNLVENHNSLVEAMNLEEKGYFNKDPKKRDSITQSAIEMGKEEKNLEELMEFGVKEANETNADEPSKADPKTEFQEAFKGTKWNAGNGFATYTDGNWRYEIYRDGDAYVSTVTSADDYDGSDVEEEEMFGTIEEARNHAERMINEYAGASEEERMAKAPEVRRIVNGSVRFEKVGKVFRLTGYYDGRTVDLDFEKLTGHSPSNSVRYEMNGNKLNISDYYGSWEKEIDFDDLSDEEIAEMIIR